MRRRGISLSGSSDESSHLLSMFSMTELRSSTFLYVDFSHVRYSGQILYPTVVRVVHLSRRERSSLKRKLQCSCIATTTQRALLRVLTAPALALAMRIRLLRRELQEQASKKHD